MPGNEVQKNSLGSEKKLSEVMGYNFELGVKTEIPLSTKAYKTPPHPPEASLPAGGEDGRSIAGQELTKRFVLVHDWCKSKNDHVSPSTQVRA